MAKQKGTGSEPSGGRLPGQTFEGHGDPTQENLSVRKGKFLQVGTAIPLSEKGISPNVKSGSSSGDSSLP